MRTWFVYLARAADGSLYCGISTDVVRRLTEHNVGRRGAKALRGRRPVELAWARAVLGRSEALKLELEIKGRSHAEKEAMCRNWRKEWT
jgi:putative endonuclease